MKFTESQKVIEETKKWVPGGVNSPARAFGAVGGNPIVMAMGEGSKIFDIDENSYVDYVLSWGPLVLGHNHPRVRTAVETALCRGTGYGAPTPSEMTMGRLLCGAVPSVEMVRMVNSGTEATSSAIRLARGYTGRDKIVKFRGCYHGHVDSLLVAAGSAAATFGVPNSPGITAGTAADTLVLEYNDTEGVKEAFEKYGSEIAGVIVEPVAGNMGCVPGKPEFLAELRRVCTDSGAVLIFDEVMSGFRVAFGGAQEKYGITPDLTTLGKVVGGGLPVGAYGGKREIMEHVIPLGKVFQAGTLSGNPVTLAAGISTLNLIRETKNFYPDLEAKTKRLADGLADAAKEAGIPAVAQSCGGMFTLFFNDKRDTEVADWGGASRCNEKLYAKYFWGMIEEGIYLPCSQFETNFTSSAHSEEDICKTLDAARKVFKKIA